jgi:hypothetical protein
VGRSHVNCSTGANDIMPIFGDFPRFSTNFTDFRRFFTDFRRFLPISGEFYRFSAIFTDFRQQNWILENQ